jgi:DnaJ-class molecular chaperone
VCSSCHTTTAWLPGTFNHSATAFPLTGAHTAATCLSCHGDGVYRGKSTACVSCHQANYNQTTNPNHASAQFPTACASCHTTTTWLGATFDHDSRYFPIYSGKHRGKWSSCATCHTSPTNYQVFTCLTCHEHNKTSMDDKHKSMSSYRYDSATCYSCHPRGTKP